MAESMKTRLARWRFNLFPAYRGSGARVTYVAHDWKEVRVKLPLNWRSRNYVGTTFGGSLYTAVDPHYMIMLIQNLGPDYVVWDKAARIEFKKPGRGPLYATFRLEDSELAAIRAEAGRARSIDRVYRVDLVDGSRTVHASVEKTVYIRRRRDDETPMKGRGPWWARS